MAEIRIADIDSVYVPFGFSVTGLYYCKTEDSFYLGNIGKVRYNDSTCIHSTIEIISGDLCCRRSSIDIGSLFPAMQDVQGITMDKYSNIWFCSCRENAVYSFTPNDQQLRCKISVPSPTGICYDKDLDCIWCLNATELMMIKDTTMTLSYPIAIEGQDQICYCPVDHNILMTAGNDYSRSQSLYRINKTTGKYSLICYLQDSYAIEGVAIRNDSLFIANDGYYHNAKIPYNQININKLSK